MKVYLVFLNSDTVPMQLIGVYSNRSLAEGAIETVSSVLHPSRLNIVEWEVDA